MGRGCPGQAPGSWRVEAGPSRKPWTPHRRGDGQFPRSLGYLAALGGVLLVIVYLGRLIVVDPETFFLKVSAVIVGLFVSPAFCLWTGIELIRNSRQVGAPAG
jgi:hypothetical protein